MWREALHPIDFYYWYFGTLALFQNDGPGGARWKPWGERVKAALVPHQKRGADLCVAGSWDPAVDRWGFAGGRVYATALNVLTLEVFERYRNVVGGNEVAPRRLEPSPAKPPHEEAPLFDRRAAIERIESVEVSVNFSHTPFLEAIDDLRVITGLEFALAPGLDRRLADVKVDLRFRGVLIKDILELILSSSSEPLTYEVEPAGRILIRPQEEPAVR